MLVAAYRKQGCLALVPASHPDADLRASRLDQKYGETSLDAYVE